LYRNGVDTIPLPVFGGNPIGELPSFVARQVIAELCDSGTGRKNKLGLYFRKISFVVSSYTECDNVV
jgi:hypothetical protein